MSSTETCRVEFIEAKLEDLDRLWGPFMKLSRALGSFPFVQERSDGVRPCWKKLWNFHSICVLCVFCALLCLDVVPRFVGGGEITIVDVDFVSVAIFPIHLIASTVGFIYFLNFTSHLNNMRHLWSSLTFTQETSSKITAMVKRKMKCGLVLCSIAMIQVVYGSEIYRVVNLGLPATNVLHELFLAMCIIVHVIQTGLFCTLCCAISCLLHGFSQDMEITLTKENMSNQLKFFKDTYAIIVDFIQACLDTYTLVVHTSIHKNIPGLVTWVLYTLITTAIVCLSAGKIHDQASRPYRILLKLEFSTCSALQQNETLQLLDCFKNLEVIISMFRVIPVTMQTLPTIFSFLFSYMVLLFQFPAGPKNTSTPKAAMNESVSY